VRRILLIGFSKILDDYWKENEKSYKAYQGYNTRLNAGTGSLLKKYEEIAYAIYRKNLPFYHVSVK
jgi:hypothetical protein